mmetsp:Transcript_73926/g.119238  ORF Transcript_73926/g.119238 Transcript_73926/m.119238 type:complete len:210 (+) Transcript_73926:818-1447(+)
MIDTMGLHLLHEQVLVPVKEAIHEDDVPHERNGVDHDDDDHDDGEDLCFGGLGHIDFLKTGFEMIQGVEVGVEVGFSILVVQPPRQVVICPCLSQLQAPVSRRQRRMLPPQRTHERSVGLAEAFFQTTHGHRHRLLGKPVAQRQRGACRSDFPQSAVRQGCQDSGDLLLQQPCHSLPLVRCGLQASPSGVLDPVDKLSRRRSFSRRGHL